MLPIQRIFKVVGNLTDMTLEELFTLQNLLIKEIHGRVCTPIKETAGGRKLPSKKTCNSFSSYQDLIEKHDGNVDEQTVANENNENIELEASQKEKNESVSLEAAAKDIINRLNTSDQKESAQKKAEESTQKKAEKQKEETDACSKCSTVWPKDQLDYEGLPLCPDCLDEMPVDNEQKVSSQKESTQKKANQKESTQKKAEQKESTTQKKAEQKESTQKKAEQKESTQKKVSNFLIFDKTKNGDGFVDFYNPRWSFEETIARFLSLVPFKIFGLGDSTKSLFEISGSFKDVPFSMFDYKGDECFHIAGNKEKLDIKGLIKELEKVLFASKPQEFKVEHKKQIYQYPTKDQDLKQDETEESESDKEDDKSESDKEDDSEVEAEEEKKLNDAYKTLTGCKKGKPPKKQKENAKESETEENSENSESEEKKAKKPTKKPAPPKAKKQVPQKTKKPVAKKPAAKPSAKKPTAKKPK